MKRGMWLILLALALQAGPAGATSRQADTLRVLFWNLENFFDNRNDSTSVSEGEFSSFGERHWSRRKFETKSRAIAKGILWAASQEGGLPDVIGLTEVENYYVLWHLLRRTPLRKLDYSIVHFDSPDPRGIDVALLYRTSRLKKADAKPCHLYNPDSTVMATRDILLFVGRQEEKKTAFLVNHHPSKYGGAAISEPRREMAVRRLAFLADSLRLSGITRIVAMGDFNDTPANPVYKLLEPGLRNLAEPLWRQGKGTIKYDGEWELIDMFFVSEECRTEGMKILQIPFLQAPDKGHAGTKPLRTYSGPRYIGGVSDHCPIWINLLTL
ncbi:MAG: endonuclease/exonuclease/phosphatase family protein [Bacteroidales bacterium]|nr:endonuclease/exonuclease/phosphatase family protein [Bacteroidales bacterium]